MKMPISTDVRTGSSKMQPIYDAGPLYGPLREVHEADWPTLPPADDSERLIRTLEARFARWRKAKDLIDADWLKDSRQRVQEAAKEIDADELKIALAAEEEKRLAYFTEDALQNEAYIRALGVAIKKSADARNAVWLAAARARLARATRAINAETNRRDRKLLDRKRR
jgi:hypothetical protein